MSAGRRIAVPDDVHWRRMHPVSPLLEGWKVVTAVVAVLTVRNADNLVEAYRYATAHGLDMTSGVVRWAVAGTLVAGAAVVAGLFLRWWATTYAVDRDGVYLRRGILVKQLRVARSPRIQSVDIVHPLLGRVFGLGQLTVEVAGGSDSRVVIGYLSTARLEDLRDRILDLAAGAGRTDGADGAGDEGGDGGAGDGGSDGAGDGGADRGAGAGDGGEDVGGWLIRSKGATPACPLAPLQDPDAPLGRSPAPWVLRRLWRQGRAPRPEVGGAA